MKNLNRDTGVADRSILRPALLACVGALGMLLSLGWSSDDMLVRPLSASESMRVVGATSQGGTFPQLNKLYIASNFKCPPHDGTANHCTNEASVGQACFHCNTTTIQRNVRIAASEQVCNALIDPLLADCPKRVVGIRVMQAPGS